MIPKKIHYCWFGGKEKPESVLKIINQWKIELPDYQIFEWNESNFDLNLYSYVKEAHDLNRYAFVTDVVRLFALYNHGGIYMDTDVEVIKSLDKYLIHPAFTGCENSKMCVTGLMASEKGNLWIKGLLDEYEGIHFINDNGSANLKTNTESITTYTVNNYSWKEEDIFQDLGDVVIYPSDFFCAKDWVTGKINITDNTHTIHHFNGSWKTDKEIKKSKIMNKSKTILIAIFGEKFFNKINEMRK